MDCSEGEVIFPDGAKWLRWISVKMNIRWNTSDEIVHCLAAVLMVLVVLMVVC